MKRFFLLLLVACSMLQVTWGQESSQSNTQSPFVGEWSGIYTDHSYKYKLIVRIDQYGQEIDVRLKTLCLNDNSIRYGNKCVVTNVADQVITFVEKGEEWYDEDDRTWNRFDKYVQLSYSNGRLHFSPYKEIRYENGKVASNIPLTEHYYQNIFLHPNDNW